MSAKSIHGLWHDDITFCMKDDCKRVKCPRNQANILNHSIPHSFFVEIPPDCPYRKKQDNFYHTTRRGGKDA